MLRSMLGDAHSEEHGIHREVNQAIEAFCRKLRNEHDCGVGVEAKWIRLDLWAMGLGNALNELEQSVYCSQKFGLMVTKASEEEMSQTELDDYYRHIYFYKNAIIRLFSTLDKTGYFLDILYGLQTGRVKSKFSYFTVLRQLRKSVKHAQLEQQLYEIRMTYKQPMELLRKKRNLEIHSMNAELVDDIWRIRSCFADQHYVEPIPQNSLDLDRGLSMVTQSLHTIFTYCTRSE